MAETVLSLIIKAKDEASKPIADVKGHLKGIGVTGAEASGRASGGLGGLRETALRVAGPLAIIAGAAGLGAIFKSAIDMNAQLESSTLQFTTLLGNADDAKEHVKDLYKFGAETPFETGPIIEASKKLLTFGGTALDTRENLTLYGNAAAATGQNIDEVAFWVGRAYSAIQAGKPFGEASMRLQEMGIMTATGRTNLEELTASGASSETVWASLRGEFGRFDGAMETQAKSWKGLTSTIKDNLMMALATGLKPFFDKLKEFATWLATFVQSETFTGLLNTMATIMGVVANVLFTVLKVAFEAIALVIQNVVVPIFRVLVAFWQEVLQPAIQKLRDWWAEHFEAIRA